MSADPQQAWYSWPKWAESLRTHTRSALQSHCGNILLLCSVPLVRLALASAAYSRTQTGVLETVKFLLDQKRGEYPSLLTFRTRLLYMLCVTIKAVSVYAAESVKDGYVASIVHCFLYNSMQVLCPVL